jgi:hypothetical protein
MGDCLLPELYSTTSDSLIQANPSSALEFLQQVDACGRAAARSRVVRGMKSGKIKTARQRLGRS